jgi:Transcription termination factor nusG
MEVYPNALGKTKDSIKELHALDTSLTGLADVEMTVPEDGEVVVPHCSIVVSYEVAMEDSTILPSRAPQNLEWFAVHTWSQHEKSVFTQLREKEIETFLPLYRSSKKWKNGQSASPVPLFPGYLFVRIDSRNQLPVLQTSGVARFVSSSRKPAVIPDSEVTQLQTAAAAGIQLSPHAFLTIGNRVRIKRGPLAVPDRTTTDPQSRTNLSPKNRSVCGAISSSRSSAQIFAVSVAVWTRSPIRTMTL